MCFKPATVEGGEFFIADAAKIARDFDADVAQRIYDRKIRISVSNLDMDFLEGADFDINLPDIITEDRPAEEDGSATEGTDHGGRSRPRRQVGGPEVRHGPRDEVRCRRQADAHASHRADCLARSTAIPSRASCCGSATSTTTRYLRDGRPCTVPGVGMTEVFYGDLSSDTSMDLDHINEVSQKNIRDIPMQPGGVLLCDNYRVLHGRNVFKGDRYHAVSWFGGLVKDRPADF